MTPGGWARAVALWRAVWPDRALPDSSIETWYDLLGDLDDAEVIGALAAWANDPDRSWPPQSPGEIRSQIAGPDDGWTEAIGRLATLVRTEGRYAPRPEIEDEALNAYIDSMGGWRATCDRFDPGDSTVRAQFRDHYRSVRTRERRDRAMQLGRGVLPALGEGRDDE